MSGKLRQAAKEFATSTLRAAQPLRWAVQVRTTAGRETTGLVGVERVGAGGERILVQVRNSVYLAASDLIWIVKDSGAQGNWIFDGFVKGGGTGESLDGSPTPSVQTPVVTSPDGTPLIIRPIAGQQGTIGRAGETIIFAGAINVTEGITFASLGAGIVQSSAGGVLSSDYTINATTTWATGTNILPADASGQDLGDATHRWDLFGAVADISVENIAAGGGNSLQAFIYQTDGTGMTGTLRGAYLTASGGNTANTGTIRGAEIKARAGRPGETGNDVAVLEGFSVSSDAKTYDVTTHRGGEIILDGGAGTSALAVGLRIANNFQANRATTSYGLQIYRDSFDYTADIQLSHGHTIADGTSAITLNTALSITSLTITGATGTNVITVPDNLADALHLSDAGGLEYLRIISTNAGPAQAVVFNNGEADIDFRVAASGVADALQVQGSDGQITLGALTQGVVSSSADGVLSVTAGSAIVGTGANTQVAYWTAADTLAGDAGLTYNAATDSLTIGANLAVGRAVDPAIAVFAEIPIRAAVAYGLVSRVIGDQVGANASSNAGYFGSVNITGAGNLTNAGEGQTGVWGDIQHYSASVVARTNSIRSRVIFSGAGATGSITTHHGIFVGDATNSGGSAGSIGTQYGIYIEDLNFATANWAIYSLGANSYHAGRFAMGGTVAALAQLHVDQLSASGAIPTLILDQGDVSEQHIVCTMSGADVDFPAIIQLAVTGTPTLGWNETADEFTLNKGIQLTGNLTFIDDGGGLVFGSCYGNHIGWQQAAAAQNTWYNVSDADMVSGPLHNVTHDGNGMLTVTEPGMYLVTYSICFQDDAANDHVEAGIEVSSSGAAEAAGQCHLENKFASEEEHMSSSTVLDLADNATLEVCIRTTDAGTPTIDVQALNLTCAQIGGT